MSQLLKDMLNNLSDPLKSHLHLGKINPAFDETRNLQKTLMNKVVPFLCNRKDVIKVYIKLPVTIITGKDIPV